MEENYRLEKEYKLSHDIFRDAYREFQKKNVYPKSYIFMALFLVIAVIYIIAAIKDPSSTLAYILIVICIALAVREWYNPRKARANMIEAVKALGEVTYKLGVGDSYVDISTINTVNVENYAKDEEEISNENEELQLPEKTRIPLDNNFSVQEYSEFFILYSGKEVFYIVPKAGFTEYELELVRELNLQSGANHE